MFLEKHFCFGGIPMLTAWTQTSPAGWHSSPPYSRTAPHPSLMGQNDTGQSQCHNQLPAHYQWREASRSHPHLLWDRDIYLIAAYPSESQRKSLKELNQALSSTGSERSDWRSCGGSSSSRLQEPWAGASMRNLIAHGCWQVKAGLQEGKVFEDRITARLR